MAGSPNYDRERAKRYKKWWARQKGAPQGQLIEVSEDSWQRKPKSQGGQDPGAGTGTGTAEG